MLRQLLLLTAKCTLGPNVRNLTLYLLVALLLN